MLHLVRLEHTGDCARPAIPLYEQTAIQELQRSQIQKQKSMNAFSQIKIRQKYSKWRTKNDHDQDTPSAVGTREDVQKFTLHTGDVARAYNHD